MVTTIEAGSIQLREVAKKVDALVSIQRNIRALNPVLLPSYLDSSSVFNRFRNTPEFDDLCTQIEDDLSNPLAGKTLGDRQNKAAGSFYEVLALKIMAGNTPHAETILPRDATRDFFRELFPDTELVNHYFGLYSLKEVNPQTGEEQFIPVPDGITIEKKGRTLSIPSLYECTLRQTPQYFIDKLRKMAYLVGTYPEIFSGTRCLFVVPHKTKVLETKACIQGVKNGRPRSGFAFTPLPFTRDEFSEYFNDVFFDALRKEKELERIGLID